MKNDGISFAKLRGFLEGLGFVTAIRAKSYLVMEHPRTGCQLIYPTYQDSDEVAPVHLGATRRFLDEFGLVPDEEFLDRLRERTLAG